MPRGRPVRSVIRQNIVEILYFLGEGYGYEIAKLYNEIFPPATQRSIYYHLRKGVQTREFELHEIREETGEYSWGNTVEKVYYTLGPQASAEGKNRVKEKLEQCNKEIKEPKLQPSRGVFMRFADKFRKVKSPPTKK